ncbi:MAG: DUF423 domain-containing protein [Verrucomicrobia bacterium]|nr:MAG: DUF423 domain-containing protein [Verrucomicrobiota bacterium]
MNYILRTAAVFGFLAVALGAFGSHGLRQILQINGTASIWQTATFYHFVHVLGLLWLGNGVKTSRSSEIFICWVTGIVLFCGSLYLLAVTGYKWLGAVTPLGGLSFLLGWAVLLLAGPRT